MENSEGKMIIQAIRELSVKVDQISGFNQQLTEKKWTRPKSPWIN